ncbi:SAM hydrolase/SAM-dependent halogenase family protein [Caldithrix abyssi]
MIITFMTDFGTKDGYVGSVKGVLLKEAPDALIVDITHEIPPFNIPQAAYCLLNYYNSFPDRTVHLVVVDPGVGSERKPLIIQTMNYHFVGPDNGVFDFVLKKEAYRAFEILPELVNPEGYSSTFHGRDIFAPAAALLAKGVKPEEIAAPLDRVIINDKKELACEGNICKIPIVSIDHFGNIIFALSREDLKHWKKSIKLVNFKTFSSQTILEYYAQQEPGKPLALWNSQNMLEIALTQGRAADFFNVNPEKDRAVIELTDVS